MLMTSGPLVTHHYFFDIFIIIILMTFCFSKNAFVIVRDWKEKNPNNPLMTCIFI